MERLGWRDPQRDNARVKAESATAAMTAAMASREEEVQP